jgi:type I restriction enzyme R subunit
VNLLKRVADAGQLRRALFVCDRDELRIQGTGALQAVFGADAAPVSGGNPQKNARVLIATYQTLDVDSEEADANFLTTHYPENYFSHIIIDECHRSAWGKWSQVLTRNPDAVQIGLTATPRTLEITERSKEAQADAKVSADNLAHFGPPVYEYDMSQGIEDGYLAACEILRRDIFLDDRTRPDRETGVEQEDLHGKTLRDADTGEPLGWVTARTRYDAPAFEDRLLLPERVSEMARDLFQHFLATGGPEQKTIIFCARDRTRTRSRRRSTTSTPPGVPSREGHGRSRMPSSARRRRVDRSTWPICAVLLGTTSWRRRWTCSPPVWTCRASGTSSSSSTCARPSRSTRW